MTTIRRMLVDDDWCYQILPDNHPQDRETFPFVPWTKLPPEVMSLISLCLLGLQEGLEPVAPNEWQVPSRALERWTNASREAAHQNQDSYMERDFRYAGMEAQPAAEALPTDCDIRLEMCDDLDQAIKDWLCKGFKIVGWVDAVLRGNEEPPERPALTQAKRVGATVVLYKLLPAKLKAVKRLPDESIDLASLLADPPRKLRPDGFYVVKATFLRKV